MSCECRRDFGFLLLGFTQFNGSFIFLLLHLFINLLLFIIVCNDCLILSFQRFLFFLERIDFFGISAPRFGDFSKNCIHHELLNRCDKRAVGFTVVAGISNAHVLDLIEDRFEFVLNEFNVFVLKVAIGGFLPNDGQLFLDEFRNNAIGFFVVDLMELGFHFTDELLEQVVVFQEQLLGLVDVMRFQLEEIIVDLLSRFAETGVHVFETHEIRVAELLRHFPLV